MQLFRVVFLKGRLFIWVDQIKGLFVFIILFIQDLKMGGFMNGGFFEQFDNREEVYLEIVTEEKIISENLFGKKVDRSG